MAGFADTIADLVARVADLERRVRNQSRTGTIEQVDAAKGLARVRLMHGETPFLTGWLPWEEPAAGANKTHLPPSIGQQVKICSESGDLSDATIQSSINSDANTRPSGAGDSYVLSSVGAASITISGGGSAMVLKVGGSTVTLTAGGIALSAPKIDLN